MFHFRKNNNKEIVSPKEPFIFQEKATLLFDAVVGVRYLLESSVTSGINLQALCSFTNSSFYPSSSVAKGPCLFVAPIILAHFLCNLFPTQSPTWSGSIKLLKVEAFIPASPFLTITFGLFFSPQPKV